MILLYVKSKNDDTFKLIYKTETDSQAQRINYGYWEERQGEGIVWEFEIDIYIQLYLKQINDQDLFIQREFCSRFCNNLIGNIIWKRIDTCICITESFCCTLETNTTMLINYAPIQNNNYLKRKKNK